MIKVTITCEDYWVADSLHNLGTEIECTDILDSVYENGEKARFQMEHCEAVVERIEED